MGKTGWICQIPLIAAAILISFIIWIMAKMSTQESEQLTVPILLENLPVNARLDYNPKTIPIMISFPQSQKSRVIAQNFEVRFDVRRAFGDDPRSWAGVKEPIQHASNLTLDNIHRTDVPESVRVTELVGSPRLQLDASLLTQTIPVKVQTAGALPPNFELRDEPRADPPQITVTASPDALKRLAQPGSSVQTETIKLAGHTKDFLDYVNLLLPTGIKPVDEKQTKIQVFIGIREKELSRAFPELPIRLFVFTAGTTATVTPPTAEVRVKARVSILDRITPSMFAFAPKDLLPEEPGVRKNVELVAAFADDVPKEIRENAEIEGLTPSKVQVEFAKALAPKSKSSSKD